MASMEDQLLQLLGDTQSAAEGPRKQAELHLHQLRSNEAFPTSLAAIASHASVSTNLRQSALLVLRGFVEKNWEGLAEGGPLVHISDASKETLKNQLLELAVTSGDEDRKVRHAASYVVSSIARVEFPESWPNLLPSLLNTISTGSDTQLYGALKVLSDLVEDALNEEQFFSSARDVIKVVYDVSVNQARKETLRALAVSIFRSCFDMMEMVKETNNAAEVKGFADEVLSAWSPFFMDVMKSRLPPRLGDNQRDLPKEWNGIIALKLQVVKTLMKIRQTFPQLLLPQSPVFFTATWEELSAMQESYRDMYIDHDDQGRLEDADGLPYTLDFLVLEELDFLQSCLRAPPVQKELDAQIQANGGVQNTPWVMDVMKLAVAYAQIPNEEEGLWGIDVNLYLAEETSVTANYTARTACGDLLIKLGEWLHQGAVEGLLAYTKVLFADPSSTWRMREASLALLTQLMNDFLDVDKPIAPEVAASWLEYIDYAVTRTDEELLRARGYLVAGAVVQTYQSEAFLGLLDRTIKSANEDASEVVRVACIKSIEGYVKANIVGADRQVPIAMAISEFLNQKDLSDLEESDDLLVTLVDTLRATIRIDARIAIAPGNGVVDLLFMMAKYGASNVQLTILVEEAFEEIVSTLSSYGTEAYTALCTKVLPTLTGAFDVGNMTDDNPLMSLATTLLASLTENGSEPLPPGFIAATMPKLNRLLMSEDSGEILRPGVETIKFMLIHDHQQMFEWRDETGRSGLEVCLLIVDRLLGPSIEDNAASQVGGLAAELVEKAGHERLGPFLPQLLQAVASRLATAEAASFIQSLILVFARLSLVGAHDVVEFLSQIQINGQSGLQIVLSKWLENSVNFAGYDEIRQNVIALSKLYSINDPRVTQTMVKGDLIITKSNRIMTRSQTKNNPDQYTIIPAPLKIIKVLIEELLSASGAAQAASAVAAAQHGEFDDSDGEHDDWEDVPNTLDLGLGSTMSDLMAWGEGKQMSRQKDDETQAYLIEFFVTAERENTAGFAEYYGMLSDDEKRKLGEVAAQATGGA